MIIQEIQFVGSFTKEKECPVEKIPEFAFIGRSNVGKSSLINMLLKKKELARISKQPGKTQLLNFFRVNDAWNLVDLPGYGYAKVSKVKREQWEKMIYNYLGYREQLSCTFLLIDSRHELQELDRKFIQWLGEHGIPFVIVFTKVDKLKRADVNKNIKKIKMALLKEWEELPPQFVTSSEKQEGRDEILGFVESLVQKSGSN
jgi:GTP-binding protein